MAISTDKTPYDGRRLESGTHWASEFYNPTGAGSNCMVCWIFDVRDIASSVQNKYPGTVYLESISGYVNAGEVKHGQGINPVIIPNISPQPFAELRTIHPAVWWNAPGRGSVGNVNCDSRKHTWQPWNANANSSPIPVTELLSSPLPMAFVFKNVSGRHTVRIGNCHLYNLTFYYFRPGFPGWCGNIMSQNGRAVPGWVSQLVSGNWLTSFVGGKQYI